jgi:excisionase family DNA binding protein
MKNDLEKIAIDIAEIKNTILSTKSVFTPREASRYLGIALSTLYKLTCSGRITFSKPNGKLIYFSKIELDKWILSNSTKSNEQKETEASTYVTTHR